MKHSCSTEQSVDILIVGGGLAGAALMLALSGTGYSTLLVESQGFSQKIRPDFDARTLALSPASERILSLLKVWPLLRDKVTPIDSIHVSEQGSFGTARLHSKPQDSLGYVVEMQHINQALHQLLDLEQVLAPAQFVHWDEQQQLATVEQKDQLKKVHVRMIVAADGMNSTVRNRANLPIKIKKYQQTALVANIGLARSHANRAYERFTAYGPLALLPISEQRSSLIWALPPEKANEFLNLEEQAFLNTLQLAFGYKLGRFVKVGKRSLFPLQQAIMPIQVSWPLVFIGNAAHTLHPVAGQGFNLGLRDVAALAQCIVRYGLNAEMLQHYVRMRNYDQKVITHFTDGLVELFTSSFPGVGLARRLGMVAMDNSDFLKNLLSFHARGYSGIVPDLVCGIDFDLKETQ